jgi:hypothetical protein
MSALIFWRADLVFIQNGMLQPWMDSVRLGSNTQALIYFAVAKLGQTPTDGVTDVNPEGLTAVTGKHAESFAARLHSAGLKCHVLGNKEYTIAMLEKLVWIWCVVATAYVHGAVPITKELKTEIIFFPCSILFLSIYSMLDL